MVWFKESRALHDEATSFKVLMNKRYQSRQCKLSISVSIRTQNKAGHVALMLGEATQGQKKHLIATKKYHFRMSQLPFRDPRLVPAQILMTNLMSVNNADKEV